LNKTLPAGTLTVGDIPADLLRLIRGLNLQAHEAPALEKAEVWCKEHVPKSAKDLEGNQELIDDFAQALGLPRIPERKLRARLAGDGPAASSATPAGEEEAEADLKHRRPSFGLVNLRARRDSRQRPELLTRIGRRGSGTTNSPARRVSASIQSQQEWLASQMSQLEDWDSCASSDGARPVGDEAELNETLPAGALTFLMNTSAHEANNVQPRRGPDLLPLRVPGCSSARRRRADQAPSFDTATPPDSARRLRAPSSELRVLQSFAVMQDEPCRSDNNPSPTVAPPFSTTVQRRPPPLVCHMSLGLTSQRTLQKCLNDREYGSLM
jgi:hypothetical protein